MSFLARVIWKILTFPLTRIIIAIIAIALVYAPEVILAERIREKFELGDDTGYRIVWGAINIVSICLVYVGYVRLLERRKAVELSGNGALLEFAAGSALGVALITATIACLWLGGYYRVEGIGSLPSAAMLMTMGLLPGFLEEIVTRGVVFRITEESLGTWLAMIISALLFGFLHLGNQGATWFAAICIAVEAGILLAAAFVTTRRLWFPIGLHFAWNVTQGGIFGVAVSGIPVRGLLKSTLTGPELYSGGEFGAEASLFAVAVCTSIAIVLLVRAVRQGRIIRPFWFRGTNEPIATKPLEIGPALEESSSASP